MKIPGSYKTKAPRFTMHRGRAWDIAPVVLPNGDQIEGWLDYTWGTYVYFQVNGEWRKVTIYSDKDDFPYAVVEDRHSVGVDFTKTTKAGKVVQSDVF